RWQREQASRPLAMLLPWLGLAAAAAVAAFFLAPQGPWKVAAGVGGAVWVAAGTGRFAWQRLRTLRGRLTAEMLGMVLAHSGVAVFLVGAMLVEGLSEQRELALAPGQQVELGGHAFRFDGVEHKEGPNYTADTGSITVLRDGRELRVLHP